MTGQHIDALGHIAMRLQRAALDSVEAIRKNQELFAPILAVLAYKQQDAVANNLRLADYNDAVRAAPMITSAMPMIRTFFTSFSIDMGSNFQLNGL